MITPVQGFSRKLATVLQLGLITEAGEITAPAEP